MSNEATPPPKTFTQLKDDLDSFMAELDQPAAVLSNGDITHVKVVKTHQNNHSLDGVDLMADSLSSECMSRDTEADPIALEMAVGDLERTKAELTRANEKVKSYLISADCTTWLKPAYLQLKQQFDSLTKTYFNEKTANEQERAQFIAQLNRLEEDHKA